MNLLNLRTAFLISIIAFTALAAVAKEAVVFLLPAASVQSHLPKLKAVKASEFSKSKKKYNGFVFRDPDISTERSPLVVQQGSSYRSPQSIFELKALEVRGESKNPSLPFGTWEDSESPSEAALEAQQENFDPF